MTKIDRRVQRTRELLQQALIDLLGERRYDAITTQDIVDRANVGRTTFYLHYTDKDDLFMSCHEAIVGEFGLGTHALRTREELLSPEVPPETIAAFRHLEAARSRLYPLFQSKDSPLMLRRIRDRSAQAIEASLCAAFAEADSTIPLALLASYLAGAQIALVHWWLEQRQPYTFEELAQAFHQMQRAAICDAFSLRGM